MKGLTIADFRLPIAEWQWLVGHWLLAIGDYGGTAQKGKVCTDD
jgi:hypothetical protein